MDAFSAEMFLENESNSVIFSLYGLIDAHASPHVILWLFSIAKIFCRNGYKFLYFEETRCILFPNSPESSSLFGIRYNVSED